MESKWVILALAIVGTVFASACITGQDGGGKTHQEVEIKSARYQAGNLLLALYANESIKTVRIDILNNQGEVLCSKYKDLAQGMNQLELTECEVENDIKVSVGSSGGLFTKEFDLNLPVPSAKIVEAKYEQGDLVVTFDANLDMKNARFEAVSGGDVLCTKYIDLNKGTNRKQFAGCGVEEKITVSLTPPGGKLVTKDLTLEMPLLKLQKGFRYDYSVVRCSSCSAEDVSIYVTDETPEGWSGIAGIKTNQDNAFLRRYKISKSALGLQATAPLSEEQLGQADLEYKPFNTLSSPDTYSLAPFWLLILGENGLDLDELVKNKTATVSHQAATLKVEDTTIKNNFLAYTLRFTQGGPSSTGGQIYAATPKPYLLLSIIDSGKEMLSFKGPAEKEFSPSDYDGYAISSQTQNPVQEPQRPVQEMTPQPQP